MPNPTTQAYSELQEAFDHYNRELFNGELKPCLITMQREKRTYGYFSHRRFVHHHDKSVTDEIAMNPSYFAVVQLLEVLQTLVHEMTHLWQAHFGKPGRRCYHNKEWAEKMEDIGLMPSDTGKPGGAKTGEKVADYPIEGSRFMTATEALLASGFRVSWLDRQIASPPSLPRPGGDIIELSSVELHMRPIDTELGGLLVSHTGSNRSNRVKYRCPKCGTQVWGKPGLRLLCGGGECDTAGYEAIE